MKPFRVFVADDHALVRAGLCSLIEKIEHMEVVGEAGNGREALEKIAALNPDVVLMDISMPELNGLEAIERLSKDQPEVRVIVLSVYANEEYIIRAFKAGVSGYVLKDADRLELEVAIKVAATGKRYLSSGISKQVLDEYVSRTGMVRSEQPFPDFYQLTSRQREILQLIAEGNTTKDIARKLDLSVKTVESHRTELMKRLDIHDVTGLVRYAIRIGLISSE